MNCIGSIGRLGNQMFQYAALRSLAKKFNYNYCLPIKNYKLDNEDLDLFDCFLLNNEEKKITDFYSVEIENPGFDEKIFNKCPDWIDLYGYFQDVKYFEDNSEDIRKSFTFRDNHFEIAKNYFYNICNQDTISLHIRRNDFLKYPFHPVQKIDYYAKALKYFDDKLKVIIFTDDIDWSKQQDLFRSDRFLFSINNNNAVDLCMQTFCKYHIIANSTFSWWGAWLANSKKVVKPNSWFDEGLRKYENFLNVKNWIAA